MATMTREDWQAKAQTLEFLGEGISRMVYAIDATRVIKICGKSATQSDSEVRAWRKADDVLRERLARVIRYGQGWSIMERATCTLGDFVGMPKDYDDRYLWRCRNPSKNAFADSIMAAFADISFDNHAWNIGYFHADDSWKLIDYGM